MILQDEYEAKQNQILCSVFNKSNRTSTNDGGM
jgi:hypothetical protein